MRQLVRQGRYAARGPLGMLREGDDEVTSRALADVGVTAWADRPVDALSEANANGSGWPWRWPRTPACSSSTSRPPISICGTSWKCSRRSYGCAPNAV